MALPPTDDQLSIDTPENVTFGYRVAGIGSRFLAALVDSILIVVLLALTSLLFSLLIVILEQTGLISLTDAAGGPGRLAAWLAAGLGLLSFVFLWGYYILFELLWNGQSPGKRWVGLRVIRTDGAPITVVESIVRNLVRLIDFLPAYYGVGVVTMFIHSQSRRLGDLAAGTLVVHDRAAITLESLAPKTAAQVPTATEGSALPIERLTNQDLALAEEFLRRREQLANRATLAPQVALALAKRMNLPQEALDASRAEDFISQVVQAHQARA
jgi:uncharacterized RDD family membrane protein YckC